MNNIRYWSINLLIAIIAGGDIGTCYGKYLVSNYDFESILLAFILGTLLYGLLFYMNYRYFIKKRK